MIMRCFANIAHEVRNPITIIAGPLMMLNADKALPQSVHRTLNHVCMSVNRMLRLIDQMLDFNQLETDELRLKVAEVDVIEALRQQVAAFGDSARIKGIRLELVKQSANYWMWLDLDKLEKILGNLFTNALKHTEPGGVIRIQAGVKEEMLMISVFNSGKTIKEDKLQDVFKRYYQLADTQNPNLYGWGTGFGLYYNKVEIAEQEKRVMQIPLSADCYMEAKPEESKNMNRPKILVVDDDVDVAQYLHYIFAADYEVVNRYSAEEALADLEEVKPDLILSDIIMDKMSGYEFCRVLKNDLMFSHIPVILITAMSKMSEQIEGLKLGAVAYVTKPFAPAYLKALVVSQLQNMQTLRQRLGESTETQTLSEKVVDTLSEQDRKFMDELYQLMEKHSKEQDLSVSTMCKDMLISPAKFNYKVKELTGETPGTFFRKYKLNRAAVLLREGKLNVSEIAVLTGFSTAAHFSVAFKKQFGVSPSEYQ